MIPHRESFLPHKYLFLRNTHFKAIELQYAHKMRTLSSRHPTASLHFTVPVEATTHHGDVGLFSLPTSSLRVVVITLANYAAANQA